MAVEIIRIIIITMQWGAPVLTAFEIIRIIINIMKLRSTCTHGNWDNQNYHHHNEIKKHLNPRPPMILPLSQSSSASQVHDSLPHLLLYPSCLSLSYLIISFTRDQVLWCPICGCYLSRERPLYPPSQYGSSYLYLLSSLYLSWWDFVKL